MHDVIHLLPDHVANQIAAGEVIQRPASVIKELVENAIDAGATTIQIFLKDAGRTLIQVIDNGKGMSGTDARMAFERHATSKIKSAADLFSLRTMGFRGEALASIAAVAQVELHTRQDEDELGTRIVIEGSQTSLQQAIQCAKGSNFMVKNLFYNVPARRKFLKSNETELRQIIMEFTRIVLVYPHLHFTMKHNDSELFNLAPCHNHRQRIKQLFPSRNNTAQPTLLSIDTHTSIGSITGYIGTPDSAVRSANQFFFVNGRYMRHPYFHKAVMQAYEGLISKEVSPHYFIYFEMDPASIDVNIHPTKTEIKFEQESALWSILLASIKEALSKSHAVPSIEFDQEGAIDIPPIYEATTSSQPKININPTYNPFNDHSEHHANYQRAPLNWESLYQEFSKGATSSQEFPFEPHISSNIEQSEWRDDDYEGKNTLWFKNRFLVVSVKSGLMFIDRHQAHVRILYEQWLRQLQNRTGISQKLLFPEIIHFSVADYMQIESLISELNMIGFDIEKIGNHGIAINGVPVGLENKPIMPTIELLVEVAKQNNKNMQEKLNESIALTLAKAAAVENDRPMIQEEMNQFLGQLFTCDNPNITPDGKTIIVLLSNEEIEKKFHA